MNTTTEMAWLRETIATGRAKAIRLEARLSTAEVALDVGCTPTSVYRWELGERNPTGELGLRYAAVLRRLERHLQRTVGAAR